MLEIVQGKHNEIHESATISGSGRLVLGDCNVINEGVKIVVDGLVTLGDWNVLHNNMFLIGCVEIGHNCWFGNYTHLDGRGNLVVKNGVRVGAYGHIWTHAASAEQLEGGLYHIASTTINDDVWLVGDGVHVSPGVNMGEKSIALSHSVVASDTQRKRVYAGVPARMTGIVFWRDVSLEEKVRMIQTWAQVFSLENGYEYGPTNHGCIIQHDSDALEVGVVAKSSPDCTHFDLVSKTYNKRLTILERKFYRFIYGNKARFLPRAQ